VRVWRKVQVERPRRATSGGQSVRGWEVVEEETEDGGVDELEEEGELLFLLIARQEAMSVQERQLLSSDLDLKL